MKEKRSTFPPLRRSDRLGIALVVTLGIITGGSVILPLGGISSATTPVAPTTVTTSASSVTSSVIGSPILTAGLSQTKIVQGTAETVALEIKVASPEIVNSQQVRQPADIIVVLDRSGSMAAEKRMTYAKSAINDLLSRLSGDDRFSLITFDTAGEIVTPLTAVTDSFRTAQRSVIERIEPRGSTNMSDGLALAQSFVQAPSVGRVRKVLLLSDGEANIGITDPTQLGAVARRLTTSEAILSTVGMGLGFNETLMSSLADFGMGHYSYLENLATLGAIFDKDLQETRAVYATSSSVEVQLPAGSEFVDASGFITERDAARPGIIRILTGQLLGANTKSVMVNFRAPTGSIGRAGFGTVALNYSRNGVAQTLTLDSSSLAFDIVAPEHKADAVASINKDIYRRNWTTNNLGQAQMGISESLRAGDVDGAKQKVAELRSRVSRQEAESGISLNDALGGAYDALDRDVNDAATGAPAEKAEKQNRFAKKLFSEGQTNQRSSK